jgi:O-antigen ligase
MCAWLINRACVILNLMKYSLRSFILFSLLLLLLWSALEYGGRYLHIQVLVQVIAGGLLLLVVLEQVRNPDANTLQTYPLLFPSCLWFGSLALAWVFSVNRLASLEELLRYLMYLIIPAVLFLTINKNDILEKMSWGLVGTASLVCAIGWINLGGGSLSSTFHRTNDLAGYLLIVVPLAFQQLILAKNLFQRLVLGGAAVLILISLIVTQSRSSWAACLLSLVLLGYFHRQKLNSALVRRSGVALLLLTAAGLAFKWQSLAPRLQSLISLSILQENATAWRLELLRGAWRIFKDYPVTGSGPNTFSTVFSAYLSQPGYFSINPHNYYLQLLAETGILGLICFLVLMVVLFQRIYKNNNPLMGGVLAALLASLIHTGFDIDWSVTAIPIAFFYVAGLGLAKEGSSERVGSKSSAQRFVLQAGLSLVSLSLLILPALNYFSAQAYAQAAESLSQQEGAQARQQILKARQLAPWPSGRHHALWAELEFKEKNYDVGLFAIFKALELDRYNTEYFTTAIDLLKALKKNTEVASLMEKRITLTPYRHPSYYTEWGDFDFQQKKLSAAQKHYSLGMQAFPVLSLSRYERYTPSHRYELFRLYQHASQLAQILKQKQTSQQFHKQAQAIMLSGSPDMFVQSGLSTPVAAIQNYWYYLGRKQQALSEHPEVKIPSPPKNFEFDSAKIEFLDAERSIFSAELLYSLPVRKKGESQWVKIFLHDELQGLPEGWRIIRRLPVSAKPTP